jgi:ATP-dependent Zn protease
MSKPLNDELQIHISVKWAVQILLFVFTLTGAWYTLKQSIADNTNEIEHIKESLIEYEKLLDDRVSRLEKYKEQELEEVNKSLLSKVLGRDE